MGEWICSSQKVGRWGERKPDLEELYRIGRRLSEQGEKDSVLWH